MIEIKIDEEEVRKIYLEKLEEKLKEIESEFVFWDSKELKRRTRMSWNTIQDQFFYDPRFPKFKVGQKWYFPAKQAQAFLLEWAEERMGGRQ